MEQNLKNHAKYVVGYHIVLFGLLLIGFIGSVINLFQLSQTDNLYAASLLILLFGCFLMLFYYARFFPLRAQDRIIRAEENFRYYVLTGRTLSVELKMKQVIALRFASDEEFVTLVNSALKNNLSAKEIKLTIKNWRADHHRM